MGKSTEVKSARLLQIEAMLLAHPEGLSQAEIARRLGIARSTMHYYVADLPKHIYLDGNKLIIDRSALLINVRLSVNEITAVHIATRLLSASLDRQNPHAAAAVRKLGIALERLAPHISRHMQQSADAIDEQGQWLDLSFLRSLEILTQAWVEGRKVKIWHRKVQTEQVQEYKFCPYYIEPSSVGRSTYAIGWREPPGALRTFKIERIERVELLPETYALPADFDPGELLADAWGIWYTESEPVEVELRFSRAAASRVQETRWHKSQQLSEQEDGRLIWRACIAEPQEMLPWIRGWGADCEVLAPDWLRQRLTAEVQQLANIYSMDLKL